MNITSKSLVSIAVSLFAFSPMSGQQTKLLTAEKHNEYGLVYTLPITAFKVQVTAVKETRLAGPFFQYANKFAGTSDVIREDEEIWSIEKITVIPYGVPNEESRYLMQLKAGSPVFIGVADDGMLLSVNTKPSIPALPLAPPDETVGTPVSGKEYLQYVDEDFLSAISSFKKAQLLAEELMEIRDAKISLTRGTAETMPTDGRQLELMLQSLDRQERALMNAFTGASWKEKITRTYNFIPQSEGKTVLFRFSDFAGPVDADDLSGEPVYLNVNIIEEGILPVDAKGDEKKMPKDAVAYCIPGSADISVVFKDNTLFSRDFEMSQFGMIFGLNPALFSDKKDPSYAIFDPATGALKEIGTMNSIK